MRSNSDLELGSQFSELMFGNLDITDPRVLLISGHPSHLAAIVPSALSPACQALAGHTEVSPLESSCGRCCLQCFSAAWPTCGLFPPGDGSGQCCFPWAQRESCDLHWKSSREILH